MLLYILAPHFTAGLELRDGRAADAAPILSYMDGWSYIKILNYCRRKGWKVSETSK